MRLIDYTRGFAFRIAAMTTGLILVSMVALGSVIYLFLDDALEQSVATRIEEQATGLLDPSQRTDVKALIAEIERLSQRDAPHHFAYRMSDAQGRHIVGDNWPGPTAPGWSKIVLPDDVTSTVGSRYLLVLTMPIDAQHSLSVGRDIHWIKDVEEELLALLLWALAGGLALAALTAYLTNHLVGRRIDLVVRSAVSIMNGNLRHRVPLTGAQDEFDRLSGTLNEMLDRIQGLIANIEQVTNDIAHDLRTPLGRLRQGLEVARARATTTEAYAQAVDRAMTEADNLLTTFAAMLRIAQVEAGAQRSAFRKISLSDVMSAVVEAYELDAEEKGRRLVTAIGGGIEVQGDRDLLAQMFANLIDNALTHTPPGSTIFLTLDRSSAGIIATVADNGPGVPPGEREKIFQRFYRLEASRTTPGTGLGLSLVTAVAKLHGALLEVGDNKPGFRISLTFPLDPGFITETRTQLPASAVAAPHPR